MKDNTYKFTFDWDEEKGVAICHIAYRGLDITGKAQCMEQDYDMKSRKTGETIAWFRACIKLHKHIRDFEIKPVHKALKHMLSCISQSTKRFPNSYEYEFLQKELTKYTEQIYMINEIIDNEKQGLKQFMNDKAEFYKTIRENRNKDKAVKGK